LSCRAGVYSESKYKKLAVSVEIKQTNKRTDGQTYINEQRRINVLTF